MFRRRHYIECIICDYTQTSRNKARLGTTTVCTELAGTQIEKWNFLCSSAIRIMERHLEEQSSPPEAVSIHRPVIVEPLIRFPHQPIDAFPCKTTEFVTQENEGDFPLPSKVRCTQSYMCSISDVFI